MNKRLVIDKDLENYKEDPIIFNNIVEREAKEMSKSEDDKILEIYLVGYIEKYGLTELRKILATVVREK
jgi:hypothetical protein